ncbi:hypothetical protein FPOA_03709 [Fusarium poae]|uniref:Gfo/Idh/MocA-like oxidoreductase N-terminal domain-containing protein n=1 Tax=Fusarium poae TaxID=36050 RepID=A0A1B8ARI0_FUSPO|nr:hypothetical protein FPOA_03709 [Fusarium poae]
MPSELKKYVIVGMGVRSAMYYQAIIQDFKDVAKLVGICDTNQTRMDVANDHIVELGGQKVQTYKDSDFDKMVQEQKADVVIVTTIDLFHHHYCIRAMELGCDAITEKPMTIDEHKLQQMVDAEKKTGKQVRVLFNYRYAPHHTKVRELIDSGVIGEISTVHKSTHPTTRHPHNAPPQNALLSRYTFSFFLIYLVNHLTYSNKSHIF